MTRLLIEHRTGFDYLRRVSLSYNEARMTPLTDQNQVVLESYLQIKPTHAVVGNYRDINDRRQAEDALRALLHPARRGRLFPVRTRPDRPPAGSPGS